jgi:hypothetical protein
VLEGATIRSRIALSAQSWYSVVDVGVADHAGDRHLWRVRVFPDGRCGVARDSVALFVSERPISLDWPLRVWIRGQSHLTDIAVGRVRLWRGDPGGVDWGAVMP